jgi:PAS domain S-box-containing protein
MGASMTRGKARIAVIAPYAELKRESEAAVEELGVDVAVEEGDLAEGVRAAKRAVDGGAEVIVSRGGTALLIAETLNVPVVEIQVSPYDILRCLHRLRDYRGVIGITGFRNVVRGCESLGNMLEMKIRQFVVESEEDALEKVTAAARDGVGMIIGDAVSVKLASKLGIGGMLVASGKEAVAKAIEEAQRIAEVRIRERERSGLLRVVVDNSHDGILALDREGRITLFNPAAERIFGVKASDAVGASVKAGIPATGRPGTPAIEEFIHPDDVPDTLRSVGELAAGGKQVALTNRCRRSDGTYRWIEWRGVSFENRMFFVTARDITQKKQEMEEQANLKDQLFQSQKMETVGLLAGGVAHDFNNLLTPILGYSELMLTGLPGDHPDRAKLEHIRQAAELAKTLTMRLLAFGRKQMLHLDVVDVGDIVRRLEPVLHRTIREDIRIKVVTGETPGLARADRGQIEQALLNLAINAQDAMPGGGALTIEAGNVNLDESYAAAHPGVPRAPT